MIGDKKDFTAKTRIYVGCVNTVRFAHRRLALRWSYGTTTTNKSLDAKKKPTASPILLCFLCALCAFFLFFAS